MENRIDIRIRIHEYFPPDDKLGLLVVRLCILLEDFRIEASGVTETSIPSLDELSLAYRRTYFLRNFFKTFHELKKAIDRICCNHEFKKIRKNQGKNEEIEFKKHINALKDQEAVFKKFRDALGGHVLPAAVGNGLRELDPFAEGLFQAGATVKTTRFKFVDQIVAGALISLMKESGIPSTDNENLIKVFISEKIEKATASAIFLAHQIFRLYVKHRKLV